MLQSLDKFLGFWTHFFVANLVVHRTVERIHVGNEYGDIPRGIFVIRGENVILLGEFVSDQNSSDVIVSI